VVVGENDGRGPVTQPQLGEQVVDVRLDRALADEELGGDLERAGPGPPRPLAQILDDAEGTTIVRDYFDDQPQVEDYPYTYTDGPALKHTRSVQFQHGIGQIVSALAGAGLRIDFLNEHDFDGFQRFGSLQQDGGQYRFPAGHPRVPMMFSLHATRPA